MGHRTRERRKVELNMTSKEAKDPIGRGQQIQSLERLGTGILGIGIIVMMISVPLLLSALLVFLLVR